jgi:hypothetical protein
LGKDSASKNHRVFNLRDKKTEFISLNEMTTSRHQELSDSYLIEEELQNMKNRINELEALLQQFILHGQRVTEFHTNDCPTCTETGRPALPSCHEYRSYMEDVQRNATIILEEVNSLMRICKKTRDRLGITNRNEGVSKPQRINNRRR